MHDIICHNMDMILFYKDEQEEITTNEYKLVFFHIWVNRSLKQIISLSTILPCKFSILCWLIMLMTFDDEMHFKVYVKPHFNVWENVAKQRHWNLLQLDKYEFM